MGLALQYLLYEKINALVGTSGMLVLHSRQEVVISHPYKQAEILQCRSIDGFGPKKPLKRPQRIKILHVATCFESLKVWVCPI